MNMALNSMDNGIRIICVFYNVTLMVTFHLTVSANFSHQLIYIYVYVDLERMCAMFPYERFVTDLFRIIDLSGGLTGRECRIKMLYVVLEGKHQFLGMEVSRKFSC